jgi:hypothetical protein
MSMSGIPTLPGVPQAALSGSIGPDGASFSASLTLDKCNARPIFVYVVAKEGCIWRLFDPLSPQEKLPVLKEWTEEIKIPQGHWVREPIPPEPPNRPTPPEPVRPPELRGECIEYVVPDALFHFDKPKPGAVNDPGAFKDQTVRASIGPDTDANLIAPTSAGHLLPSHVERKIVMFAHADMCAPFSYNKGLSDRRSQAVTNLLSGTARAAILSRGACADFNPKLGPNAHEQRAEDADSGTATNPNPGTPDGNEPNRRVELFILPDYKDASRSVIKPMLEGIHDELVGARAGDPRRSITAGEWARGGFPCSSNSIRVCHKLMTPFESKGESSGIGLEQRHHRNVEPDPARPGRFIPTGQGADYRQCEFYLLFKQRIRNLCIPGEQPPTPPPTPVEPPPPPEQRYRERWVEDPPKTEVIGEYHPPPGEHYGYYMDEMVRKGVQCGPQFAPDVAVAPNRKVDPDDFNLIKAGPIRVVKMDIGFWGDERTRDLSRKAGFRRVPKRYFGLIEGQFVFLCYFQTPDNAGFIKGCSTGFKKELTPLCHQLDEAVTKAGYQILIMAKAVAEDGPDPKRLKILFPDMHMPRKFDEKDPQYATDECIFRAQMVKSMVLHQLKRDYYLPAVQTPWLAWRDRQLLRDFFDGGMERLKLPHWNTGRKFSNPFDPQGDNLLSTAVDAAKKAFQALMQVGFYMFEFTQDDYRRMVKKYPEDFPEKGYGRTKDALCNWFYGFETDRNIAPQPKSGIQEELKSMIPALVSEVADTNFGTSLGPDTGRKPATESFDRIEAGPARDLIRFLRVIQDQQQNGTPALPADVFQTGDIYELWLNRRYLFEDFDFTNDPAPQMPKTVAGLSPGSIDTSGKSAFGAAKQLAGEGLKFLVRNFLKLMLGGVNAVDTDLWYRREQGRDRPNGQPLQSPPEESWDFDLPDTDWQIPKFTSPTPGTIGGGMTGQLKTANLPYRYMPPTRFPWDANRGRGYMVTEEQRRASQVLAFEAPLRTAADQNAEDRQLLGGANVVGPNGERGLWNKAVVESFGRVGTTFIYGNHDCYRGLPRENGVSDAKPFHHEPGLWIEHGHRYEDSNIDGQPFGAFITNLAYEIQELALYEGLLDEYKLHREQDQYQPGIMQWFLLTEFGLDVLEDFKNPPARVPPVGRFRISVNSHTHVADLVVAQVIFKDREVSKIDTPFGAISAETLINGGGALLKGILLAKQVTEWYEKWKERHGTDKLKQDVMGSTINWAVDFAGLASCIGKALDFAKKYGEGHYNALKKQFEDSGKSAKDMVDENRRTLGL